MCKGFEVGDSGLLEAEDADDRLRDGAKESFQRVKAGGITQGHHWVKAGHVPVRIAAEAGPVLRLVIEGLGFHCCDCLHPE